MYYRFIDALFRIGTLVMWALCLAVARYMPMKNGDTVMELEMHAMSSYMLFQSGLFSLPKELQRRVVKQFTIMLVVVTYLVVVF